MEFACELCHEKTKRLIYVEHEDRYICPHCYDAEYARCQKCEGIFHVDHLDTTDLCAKCRDE